MKKKKIIAALTLGILCIAICFSIQCCLASQKIKKEFIQSPRTVVVMDAKAGDDIKGISFPAYVQASRKAVLFFRVSGPVFEVNVKLGDKVKKGAVLFKIDSRDYERQANLLKHQLRAEKARLEKATLNFHRYKKLHEKKAVSKQEFDQKRSEYLVEQANVSELENHIRIALDHLKDTELKAPFDGIMTEQHLEKHEMARAGEPVLAMHDISMVEVVAFVPEDEIASLVSTKNNAFQVCFTSIKDKSFKAKLYEWSTKANPVTRTYAAIFRIKQPSNNSVLPGMTAELIWTKHKSNKSLIFNLPISAFVSTTHKTGKIWLIDPKEQTTFSQTVAIGGYSDGDCLQVTSGLKPGSLVVIEGAHFLREGTKVKIEYKNNGDKK